MNSLPQRVALLNPDMAFYTDLEGYVKKDISKRLKKHPGCKARTSMRHAGGAVLFKYCMVYVAAFGAQGQNEHGKRTGGQGSVLRPPPCRICLEHTVEYEVARRKGKGHFKACNEGYIAGCDNRAQKNPYPKTYNPGYEFKVKEILNEILADNNSPLLEIINKEYVMQLMSGTNDNSAPFFGQLMCMPQLFAYLIQVNMWLRNYRISIR